MNLEDFMDLVSSRDHRSPGFSNNAAFFFSVEISVKTSSCLSIDLIPSVLALIQGLYELFCMTLNLNYF